MGRKQGTDEAMFTAAPATARVITPQDIQAKEFRVARFGGYRVQDVDEFLDELTAAVAALLADRERLRSQAGASPVVGSPDLQDVSRQADEIIRRAREQAAKIVADADADAGALAGAPDAASVTAATTTRPEDRAAVSAFLAQERDFLQGLAALVQGHAQSVKAMAKRGRQEASAAAALASGAGGGGGGQTGPSSQTSGGPAGSAELERTQRVTTTDEPIRVDEPQAATQTPSRSRTKSAGDQQNDSLRELFWGEDGES